MDLSLGSSPQQQPHPLAPRMRQRSVVLFSIVFLVVFVVVVVVFVVVVVVVFVVVFVVFGVVFAGDISGLGRLVVLTVETRSQNVGEGVDLDCGVRVHIRVSRVRVEITPTLVPA